jgi:hypothetical protein
MKGKLALMNCLLTVILLLFVLVTACKKKTLPEVSTSNATNITKDSAKVEGVLISDGNLEIKEIGICWGKNPNPTIDGSKSSMTFDGDPNFSYIISGLDYNTTYYAKAYAINKEGVGYGNEISFKTNDYNPDKMRKVFVEVFTGHTCPNAVLANNQLKTIKDTYGPKIVAMSLHVSSIFAAPLPPNYTADYRTLEGTAIDDFFNVSSTGLPKGMVNRKGFSANNILAYSSWETEVNSILNSPIEAWVEINNTYDEVQKKVTSEVKINFEKNTNDEIKLCVFLVEDNVISPQKDISAPGGIITNYAHMNMLRKALTPTFGESIITNPTTSTPQINKSYTVTLAPENNQDYCKIIAYVYKASNYEILQVQEKNIK